MKPMDSPQTGRQSNHRGVRQLEAPTYRKRSGYGPPGKPEGRKGAAKREQRSYWPMFSSLGMAFLVVAL